MPDGPDRRLVAVMFTDMVGYTTLVQADERLGLDKRDAYWRAIERQHDAFGGTIVQRLGDGSMSMFPSSLAAVRAGVELQRQLLAQQVSIRLGIHVGEVIVEPERLTGVAVNIAARIEALALPGAVMLSDSARDQVANRSDVEVVGLGRFELKNVGRPVELYAVAADGVIVPDAQALAGTAPALPNATASTAPRSPELPVRGPFVGRNADLARLVELLGVGPRGAGPGGSVGAVLLAGEAGVGKTRLLAALADEARRWRWRVLVGHCVNLGDAPLPYLPFTEVFGRLADAEPALAQQAVEAAPPVARLMPGRRSLADGPSSVERIDRAELFEGVLAAFGRLAESGPVMLVVEDLHWADASTLEIMGFLLTRPRPGRVAIVGSYRSDDLHRRHPLRRAAAEWARLPGVVRLALRPLADADVRSLIEALHPDRMPEAEIASIVSRAEGNAFFLEELLAAADLGGHALPGDLAELLLLRLDSLDEPARRVVRVAAVAGRRVSHPLLESVAGLDPAALDAGLRSAIESNVLVPSGDDGYAFRHALLAEAVHDDLLPRERVQLHAAYAAALSAGDVDGTAAELAMHARAAHDLATAVGASVAAGDEAMTVAGPDEAVRHYELALELLPHASTDVPINAVALTVKASRAAAAAGDVFRAVALVQDRLADLPDADDDERTALLHALADAAVLGDTGVDVLQLTTDLIELVPADPPSPLRARVASLHARANADRSRDETAARWATEALTMAERLRLPDVVADATTTLARLEERSGDPDVSLAVLENAAAAARAGGHLGPELRSRFNLGSLHYELGCLQAARTTFEETAARAREAGRPWAPYGFDARAMTALVAYVQGDWDEVQRIVDVRGESPPPIAEVVLTAVGLAVSAGRGQRAALGQLPRLRPYWDRDGLVAIFSGAAAIDLYGDGGDLAAATAIHADVVEAVARLWREPLFHARIRLNALLLGQVCAAAVRAPDLSDTARQRLVEQGDELAAAAETVAERAFAGRRRGPEAEAWLARLRAEHARLRWVAGTGTTGAADLVESWLATVAAFDRLGHVYEVARSRARLAAALQTADRGEEADEQVRLAAATGRRLGAAPLWRAPSSA